MYYVSYQVKKQTEKKSQQILRLNGQKPSLNYIFLLHILSFNSLPIHAKISEFILAKLANVKLNSNNANKLKYG